MAASTDYKSEFDPDAYLRHFYARSAVERGVRLALFALPNMALRLPPGGRLLDVGSGPTVYVALCLRDAVDEMHLSDYLDANRHELERWRRADAAAFDWSAVAACVARVECRQPSAAVLRRIEDTARRKTAGVWRCDVHAAPVVEGLGERPLFDVVTSAFCLESACADQRQYAAAVKRLADLLPPGGCLILVSVIEDTEYRFGGTHRFRLLYLTEGDIVEALKQAGMQTKDDEIIKYSHDGAFVIMARKL